MPSPIADGVMAATQRLVSQAMSGQWQDVPKTVEERRVLLNRLATSASPQDREWVTALSQAMAESDAVVAQLSKANEAQSSVQPSAPSESPDSLLDMISQSR